MMRIIKTYLILALLSFLTLVLYTSCARMGQPDGGWFDETPPRVIGANPGEGATNATTKKVRIYFDEYIKLDNAQEKVTICPPQMEQPDIKATGKTIFINFKDSLKANTTYTVDFSDAILDNNEGNPMGNYTYVFSTGAVVDTMEVGGYILNAENLEPIKGIQVGLYSNLSDTIFTKAPMERVARTNGSGYFIIRGVAPGSYRIYALEDSDGDFRLSQRGERLAFSHDIIVPSMKDDIRQDTIWELDHIHVKAIHRQHYNHYLPDDVTLRAFTQKQTERYFLKSERKEPDRFTLFFSNGSDELPKLKLLNNPGVDDPFLVEHTKERDTVTYWLRDSILINQDTLRIEASFLATDTLGALVMNTDTLEILAKVPYEKRKKELEEDIADWKKKVEKAEKKGRSVAELGRRPDFVALEPEYTIPSSMTPMSNVRVVMPTPLSRIDTAAIHLYSQIDSLWYRSRISITDEETITTVKGDSIVKLPPRTYLLKAEWRPGTEYSLEIDSVAFTDIYGHVSDPYKTGLRIINDDESASLFVTVAGDSIANAMVQLLSTSDAVVDQQPVIDGTAEFYYLKAGDYYLRVFFDDNANGRWDTGDYTLDLQAERVYYHPEKVTCKARWDATATIDTSLPLYKQKPLAITKQKPDAKKTIKEQNYKRALSMDIPYDPEKLQQKAIKRAERKIQKRLKAQQKRKEKTDSDV